MTVSLSWLPQGLAYCSKVDSMQNAEWHHGHACRHVSCTAQGAQRDGRLPVWLDPLKQARAVDVSRACECLTQGCLWTMVVVVQ